MSEPQDGNSQASTLKFPLGKKRQQEIEQLKKMTNMQAMPTYLPPHRQLDSLRSLYKIGNGPSSSHTMGPKNAALDFISHVADAHHYEVTLFGSLAQTGKGHKTDTAILLVLPEQKTQIIWNREQRLKHHTNGLCFRAFKEDSELILEKVYYSVGGGIIEEGESQDVLPENLVNADSIIPHAQNQTAQRMPLYYPLKDFHTFVLECLSNKIMLTRLVYQYENKAILEKNNIPLEQRHVFYSSNYPAKHFLKDQLIQSHLLKCWEVMKDCVEDGLKKTECIECECQNGGVLTYPRLAHKLFKEAQKLPNNSTRKDTLLIQAFATAVSEQNGSASHDVVTTPTCGACGVLPGLLYYYYYKMPASLKAMKNLSNQLFIDSLAVAGVIGNVCRANASVSGAEAGCQAEIGVAEAMAAAAAAYIEMKMTKTETSYSLKMALSNIEWAARNSLKNKLGLTCDPVQGLVIDPCIQRNGASALSAFNSAVVSLSGAYDTKTSLDCIIQVMFQTGKDMNSKYKESAQGGIAQMYYLDSYDLRDVDYCNGEGYVSTGNQVFDIEDQ